MQTNTDRYTDTRMQKEKLCHVDVSSCSVLTWEILLNLCSIPKSQRSRHELSHRQLLHDKKGLVTTCNYNVTDTLITGSESLYPPPSDGKIVCASNVSRNAASNKWNLENVRIRELFHNDEATSEKSRYVTAWSNEIIPHRIQRNPVSRRCVNGTYTLSYSSMVYCGTVGLGLLPVE